MVVIVDAHLRRRRRPGRACRCCSATPTPTAPTFQAGLGFTGIAVALLGRNNPVGIAFGALLFAFLDRAEQPAEIKAGISNDIVAITQGVIVLARRHRLRARPPLPAWPPSSASVAEQLAAGRHRREEVAA